MRNNKVNMENEQHEETADTAELMYHPPKLQIRRYNRCKWIMIVTLVWTALMLGTMIPGIVGLAQGDTYDDTLLYLGLISLIFAGLFFTFWYICQIETEDVEKFDREEAKKSIKRRDDGARHTRPKSLRNPLLSSSSANRDDELCEQII